jgi:trk system potassium uptake protein TrkH
VGSFALLVAGGTIGLLVLPGLYTGPGLGVVDALFTATSAVCVTGLIVVDTASYFTPLGQAWIALLIQIGGIGILTLATLLIMAAGRSMSLELEMAGGRPLTPVHRSQRALLLAVVKLTFVLEGLGAACLWLLWRGQMGNLGAIWPAVFHAISAFCNAGFSTFSDSLSQFRSAPLTLLLVSALIILGGLGFLVLEDTRLRALGRRSRFSVHSHLVLVTTAVLLAGGMLLYAFFETHFDLRQMGAGDRLVNAWFMSVTARTAGFNTVSYDGASNASIFLTMALMVVGGSPGSTAGGLKTTSVVLLLLLIRDRLAGRSHTSVAGRTIPHETLERAAGVVIGGLLVLALFIFVLLVAELPAHGELDRGHFLRLMFEAHSAFGTVGLSLGATPDLTPGGRVLVSLLMFMGRVGPLAFATSMVMRRRPPAGKIRYAHEDVVVG